MQRFYLDCDSSSHWYIIPVNKQEDWDIWNNLDSDDELAWDAPDWAIPVNGSLTLVTFENPKIG
jgi:hypothetical protein